MQREDVQNTAELRSMHKKMILYALRQYGELTKKEIVDRTCLSFATVSGLTNQMQEEGLVRQGGKCASSGGRMPALLSIRPDAFFLLAVNFAVAGEVRMALMSLAGQRVHEWMGSVLPEDDYAALLERVAGGMQALLERARIGLEGVLGGTAAVPAINDRHTGRIINSTIPLYEGRPLAADLRRALGMDVAIENEANLMALACFNKGLAEQQADDLIFLYVGEGLGIGMVSGRRLLTGAHGYGGEVGHMPLGRAGYPCYCGQTGCVETELSIRGFIRKYNGRKPAPAIADTLPLPEQWRAFAARVAAGDATALAVAKENGALLGVLAATLVNLLDPQEVIIGGYVEEIAGHLLPAVVGEMERRLVVKRGTGVPVRFAKGYNSLILAGCGELGFAKWNP